MILPDDVWLLAAAYLPPKEAVPLLKCSHRMRVVVEEAFERQLNRPYLHLYGSFLPFRCFSIVPFSLEQVYCYGKMYKNRLLIPLQEVHSLDDLYQLDRGVRYQRFQQAAHHVYPYPDEQIEQDSSTITAWVRSSRPKELVKFLAAAVEANYWELIALLVSELARTGLSMRCDRGHGQQHIHSIIVIPQREALQVVMNTQVDVHFTDPNGNLPPYFVICKTEMLVRTLQFRPPQVRAHASQTDEKIPSKHCCTLQ